MKEIGQMLKQWIPVNTIIREQFRKIIIKEMATQFEVGLKINKMNESKESYYSYIIKPKEILVYRQLEEDENSFSDIEQIINQLRNEGYEQPFTL
tara:strand:- start:538 stop:822 length:285 start_codon:yes stop_codon:yes gene_type:complete